LVTVATLMLWLVGPLTLSAQVWLLVLGVALVGLPHGALDHQVAGLLVGRRWPRVWPLSFLLFYGCLAAIVVLAWLVRPTLTLLLFLSVAWLHFGIGDVPAAQGAGPQERLLHGAEAVARGGTVLVLPALGQAEAVAGVFGWLGVSEAMPVALAWGRLGSLFWAGAVLLWLGGRLLRPRPGTLPRLAELAAVAAAALMLPPLLAFLVYFCLLHSPRHLVEVSGWMGRGWRAGLAPAVPLTVLTWLLALAAWPWLGANGTEPGLVRMVFWGLAALTLPHMVLTLEAQRRYRPAV